MLLKDKVAVITGGAGLNGLGYATARQMAAQGAKVVILDLARAEPAAAAARLGEGHLGMVADVTDKAACEAATAAVLKAFGRIDILVNNAGILRDKSFSKMTIEVEQGFTAPVFAYGRTSGTANQGTQGDCIVGAAFYNPAAASNTIQYSAVAGFN